MILVDSFGPSCSALAPMDSIETRIRDLIRQEQHTGIKLNLRQISDKVGVDYHRVWAFMSEKKSLQLSAVEAQVIYETLSGKPLLPQEEVAL